MKANPTFAELSELFDKIAVGPSKYGSLGWTYSLDLTDGNGKPSAPSKVPARYPCVLLKAISAHESVGWNQFCVPTGPVCTSVSQTIVACDCGYGLMQVTSGMDATHAVPSYNVDRVASDAAYNVSVGSQILGSKWTLGPAVGDRRLQVIENWYFATWAYNGFASSNNPNNAKYPADRKQYRDPGALSADNYPYQEKIWGLMRTPYGLKEGKGAGYKAYAVNLPNRAEICASCGRPTADVKDPAEIHPSDCPSDGPPLPPPGPAYELSTVSSRSDRISDGSSKGTSDILEGQSWTVDLVIKNAGTAVSPNVDLGVLVEAPWLTAATYEIQSDAGTPGTFKTNDADGRPDNPSKTALGSGPWTFHMNAFAIGESKRIHLTVKAAAYSLGAVDHPDVRFWVQSVTGIYQKSTWESVPDNPSKQTYGGGDLKLAVQADVFSPTHWGFDAGTLEGWTGSPSLDVTLGGKSLQAVAKGDDPQLVGPETAFDSERFNKLVLQVKSSLTAAATARVYWSTDSAPGFDESRAADFALVAGSNTTTIDLSGYPSWKGTITRLRIDPILSGSGTFEFADIRVGGPGDPAGDSGLSDTGVDSGADGGPAVDGETSASCQCDVPGPTRPRPAYLGLMVGGIALIASRRRRR